MIIRGPVKSARNFLRFVAANKLPGSVSHSEGVLPEIELLVCVIEKDFNLLERCINQAIRHSANPVSSVNIIVPGAQVESCKIHISSILETLGSKIQVIDEDSLISQKGRARLRQSLGSSYGWGLQQFLTVAYVLRSKSKGVLAVNADTIILRRRCWLNINGVQELLVSSEYHPPYYQVLRKINSDLSKIKFTFICHQMLFQPQLLKNYLAVIGVDNIEDFLEITLSNSNCSVKSPFCIEFEFYGQSLYAYDRDKISLIRFANTTFRFGENEFNSISELKALECRLAYNSVSQHSWLEN